LHVLQPLDVGVFKELKKVICGAAEDRWRLLAEEDCLSKRDFILDLAEARDKAMTGKHIRKGWESSGIWPLNPDNVSPYPYPSTPTASLTPLNARRHLQNTNLLQAKWMRIANKYPDLPSPVKRLASQLAEKHTVDRTNKLILQRQLSDYKAEVAKLQRASKPARRRAVAHPMAGSFIVSNLSMVEDLERLEAARQAKVARKGKGKGTSAGAVAATAVTAAAGPVAAVWDVDVFGAFGGVDYGPAAAGSETKTEVESNAESD
jgi:hypothetical protein